MRCGRGNWIKFRRAGRREKERLPLAISPIPLLGLLSLSGSLNPWVGGNASGENHSESIHWRWKPFNSRFSIENRFSCCQAVKCHWAIANEHRLQHLQQHQELLCRHQPGAHHSSLKSINDLVSVWTKQAMMGFGSDKNVGSKCCPIHFRFAPFVLLPFVLFLFCV